MRTPISVRALTADEQQTLPEGWRSSEAFVLRRCQILLARARGQTARVIAEPLGCDDQTGRNTIQAFHTRGLTALGGGHRPPSGRRMRRSTPGTASRGVRCCPRVHAPLAIPPACGPCPERPR